MVLLLPKRPRQGKVSASLVDMHPGVCGILEVRLWQNLSKAVRNGEVKLLMLV